MHNIYHRYMINASPEKVYQAVSTIDGLKKWWTVDIVGESSLGEVITFGFGNNQYLIKMEVTKFETNKRVEWKNVEDPSGNWLDTVVYFDIEEVEGGSVLRFGHTGWKEVTDQIGLVTSRWGVFLVSLKQYLETGKGTPHPDDMPI